MKKERTRLIIRGAALGLVCAVSVIAFVFYGSSRVNRVLFFPEEGEASLTGELRRIPNRNSDEDSIELMVKELILGPAALSFNPLLPKHTKVRTCMLRDGRVYLDLSPELVVKTGGTGLSPDESLFGVERTIRFNFPRVEEVVFFIDGEVYEPDLPGAVF